ncbi:MAG: 3-phosphoshikimate 1-carboxyvinyltransferase [Verrucomicrobiota bacterium]
MKVYKVLPDLIEIVPLEKPVRADITVPGSKSITNRALILAALADGVVRLDGALWSEDTQVMTECLRQLGFEVSVADDPNEPCNRTITVRGLGGKIPLAGTKEKPLELFVGNAGTAARFLAAFVCLGNGVYRLHGVPRMHERPQAALFDALRELGYRVDSPNNKLPALIHGTGPRPGKCRVSIEASSQFASALLLGGKVGGWKIEVVGENTEESSYIKMTRLLCGDFPTHTGGYRIEPDASSASYIHGADVVLGTGLKPHGIVHVAGQFHAGWQIDSEFPKFLPLPATVSRQRDLGDSIMTAIVLAPFAEHPVKFTDLGRLRVQECERVVALRTELTKCGAKVIEEGDTLTVHPSPLHGAEIETYHDHRMAMCFAVVGLRAPGIKLRNPACVKKTFPNFFQKLAAPPPHGLGTTILDAQRKKLGLEDLFAE